MKIVGITPALRGLIIPKTGSGEADTRHWRSTRRVNHSETLVRVYQQVYHNRK